MEKIIIIALIILNLSLLLLIVRFIRNAKKLGLSIFKEDNKKDNILDLIRGESLQAKKESEAKTKLLTNLSHEIRTPINSIMGMNELILRETKDKKLTSYARNIEYSSKALLALVDEILDFSKIETGNMQLNVIQYRFDNLVFDLLTMSYERAINKGLEFKIDIDFNIPLRMYGDLTKIREAISNMLSNAIKYTKEGSVSLKISFKKIDSEYVDIYVIVSDTGIGIKEEEIKELTKPFVRLDEGINSNIEGAGLGLNITSALLNMMGSKLELESVYGRGSTFAFTLRQQIVGWMPVGDVLSQYKSSLTKINKYKESFRAENASILVVDDIEVNTKVLSGLVSYTKIQVNSAYNGQDAINLCSKKKYDIIFLDHRMPNMDGEETLKRIRNDADSLNKESPVIVLTANVFPGVRDLYLEKGFTDYLAKPIAFAKLEELLIKYLPEEKIFLTKNDLIIDKFEDDIYSYALNLFANIQYIDYDLALQNCMTKKTLIRSIMTISTTLPNNLEKLKAYYKVGDFNNYEILVHAIKSSAKLIGAMDISNEAAYIEELCEKKQYDLIRMEHDALILLADKLKLDLANVMMILNNNENNKELITKEQLEEAYKAIKDYALIGDFRNVDEIMKHLLDYDIGEEDREKYEKVKEYSLNVDAKSLLEIL